VASEVFAEKNTGGQLPYTAVEPKNAKRTAIGADVDYSPHAKVQACRKRVRDVRNSADLLPKPGSKWLAQKQFHWPGGSWTNGRAGVGEFGS
jgi:hypothetical protein